LLPLPLDSIAPFAGEVIVIEPASAAKTGLANATRVKPKNKLMSRFMRFSLIEINTSKLVNYRSEFSA
jgi:hypothetical protein